MDYIIQNRSDYSRELLCYKAKFQIRYYSNRQMKALYPHRNFIIVGEVGGKTGVQCGVAENSYGKAIPIYKEKTHNAVTEAIAGYTAVDSHTYLSVVKNDLPKRIIVTILVSSLLAAGAAVVFGLHVF